MQDELIEVRGMYKAECEVFIREMKGRGYRPTLPEEIEILPDDRVNLLVADEEHIWGFNLIRGNSLLHVYVWPCVENEASFLMRESGEINSICLHRNVSLVIA